MCVNISDGVIFFSATDIDDLNEQLRGDRQQIQQVIEIIYMLWMVELSLDYFCCFSVQTHGNMKSIYFTR